MQRGLVGCGGCSALLALPSRQRQRARVIGSGGCGCAWCGLRAVPAAGISPAWAAGGLDGMDGSLAPGGRR